MRSTLDSGIVLQCDNSENTAAKKHFCVVIDVLLDETFFSCPSGQRKTAKQVNTPDRITTASNLLKPIQDRLKYVYSVNTAMKGRKGASLSHKGS